MNLVDSMSPAVCGAIAQIAPVFMVLMVAERVVFTPQDNVEDAINSDDFWLNAGRFAADLILALLCAFLTITALFGIEAEGYSGTFATFMWAITCTAIVLVILRWLFLSTPLSDLLTGAMRAQAQFAMSVTEGLIRSFSAIPEGLIRGAVDVIEGAIQFLVGLLSLGTAGRSVERPRRRHRESRH